MEICYNTTCSAGVAHPVERHLAKVEVASSSLVTRSINLQMFIWRFLFMRSVIKRSMESPRAGTFLCKIALYLLLMLLGELKQRQAATAAIEADAVHSSLDRDRIYLTKEQVNKRQ